ncbi:serine/threonine-protein kinase [Polyangium mundeleinium]|uniref:Protein kinase n=1 Tax=Polyangium mundeleinium TaxID=2995306 RepID=A0ABT5ENY3_9BACT|nr:serine/threonine-protein kinase [Polyangium mundeleinium]MDC0742893.1 protein kinase [Polyangium mundeleinium]
MRSGEVLDDRFVLGRRAGSGGMGTVWRAVDRITGEPVALKLLRDPEGESGPRFLKEARILSTFEHPHVVRYVAHGIAASGEPYLAMEWLEGESLLARLERGALGIEESLSLARHVADALGAAHARRIVHRDVKPSNLFLVGGAPDRVKILDFGIAQSGGTDALTRTGSILGTPGYMAPEQARGDREADARADVFALGCVLFECLSGKPAFQGAHPMALLAKLLLEEPPRLRDLRPDAPEPLAALVHRLLSKDPEVRPEDGAAVREILDRIDATARLPVSTGEPSRASLTGTERRLVSIVAVSPPLDREAPRDLVAAVRRVAIPLGARVEELSSGAVVAVLLGEGSVVDQAANAARCATWTKLAAPEAAVVLVTGRGESTNRLPVGEALERAAALLDEALSEQQEGAPVRIDDNTRALLDAHFDLVEQEGRIALRGERRTGQESRTLLGRPSPFVGRDRELRNVVDLVDESFDERRPSAVLVTAPPGMGKSRLRQELLRVVKERHTNVACTIARPDAIGAGSAFSLLSGALRDILQISAGEPIEAQRRKIELLTSVFADEAERRTIMEFLGELAGAPFPDEGRPRLRAARQNPQLMADQIEAAYRALTAAVGATRPILVVLEDLHWGDAPSLKILDAALRDLSDVPFVVLAFARPAVHEVFPRLWAGRNVQEIRLGPLPRRAATELVSAVLGGDVAAERGAALVERAEGNAFFLEELIRAVADGRGGELPDTVLGMVEARLSALAPESRRLLRAASIFGEVFWENGLRELLGDGEPLAGSLSELCARELVTRRLHSRFAGQEEYTFRHAIIREGAYAMLTDQDRHLGHRLAGAWLKRAGEPDALVLAEHFQRGRDPENAAAHYLRAGGQSFDRDDFSGALLCAQRGIACGASGEVLGNLQTLCAMAHCWRSELDAAHRASVSALPLVARGGRWACLLLFHGTWASLVVGAEEDFLRMAGRFVHFDPEPDARRDYLLWAPLAASLLTSYGRRELCRALLDRAERLAASMPALDLDLAGSLAIGQSDELRAFERAPFRQLELTRRAVSAFEAIGDARNHITALNRLGQALGEIGEREAGERALRAAVEHARRIRGPFALLQSELHLAALLVGFGESAKWAEAESIAERVLGAAGVSDGYRGWARGLRAQILLHRGVYEDAAREARVALALCQRVPLRKLWITTLLVRCLVLLRKADEARALAREIGAALGKDGGGYVEIEARLVMAEACAEEGEMEEASRALRDVVHRIEARAAEIPDEALRSHYLQAVPENVRARSLATAWL